MTIKLLIVDDSAFMRRIISDIVEEIDGVEVVGIARNGLEALEKIPKLNPDVITLDIEMPKLNGIETLKRIKENFNIPVIMLSSHSGTDITIEALQIGAIDFIEKPNDLNSNPNMASFKQEFGFKLKSIFGRKYVKNNSNVSESCSHKVCNDAKAVVIGASTGGPKALVYLISRLPNRIKAPIFIVQHMPKGFTTSLAHRMNDESKIKVVEAENGMPIENIVYLAPGDFHMTLENNRIYLNSNDRIHGVRPAVDYLFHTAAEIYKENLLGIILTGMGKDGSAGMSSIKKYGGYNIAQNEETCVVYGMPGSAVSKGVIDEILSLEEISIKLNKLVEVKL